MIKQKILIIRLSSIGDIVLTFHALRCLREQLPHAEIHFLTKPAYKELMLSCKDIDHLILLEANIKNTRKAIKAEHFTHIIDLHNNLRTHRLTIGLRQAIVKRFKKLNLKKWLLTNFKVDKLPKKHIVDRYIDTLSVLGVKNDYKNTSFEIPNTEEVSLLSYDILPKEYLTVVLGAQFQTKKLPTHLLQKALLSYPRPIILLGGKDEIQAANKIQDALSSQKIINLCGTLSLLGSASVIKQSGSVLTNDTGVMHIAAMFDVPIVSVWGNTVPSLGMYPYRPGKENSVKIHEVLGLNCRPCSKIGYQECPKGHFNCMEKQDIAAIAKDLNF
jgi:ADP-heptose:LPS heptosyltransferase